MNNPVGKVNKIARLQKKEGKLVAKANKAVDEGRDKKADRLLKRAAKTENRKIKTAEMKKGGSTKTSDCGEKQKKSFQAGMNIGRNMKKPGSKKK